MNSTNKLPETMPALVIRLKDLNARLRDLSANLRSLKTKLRAAVAEKEKVSLRGQILPNYPDINRVAEEMTQIWSAGTNSSKDDGLKPAESPSRDSGENLPANDPAAKDSAMGSTDKLRETVPALKGLKRKGPQGAELLADVDSEFETPVLSSHRLTDTSDIVKEHKRSKTSEAEDVFTTVTLGLAQYHFHATHYSSALEKRLRAKTSTDEATAAELDRIQPLQDQLSSDIDETKTRLEKSAPDGYWAKRWEAISSSVSIAAERRTLNHVECRWTFRRRGAC